jgi:hypothetical protein
LHVNPQVPFEHVGVAFAVAGHAVQLAPQCSGSLCVLKH